jgi:hypothetical protein
VERVDSHSHGIVASVEHPASKIDRFSVETRRYLGGKIQILEIFFIRACAKTYGDNYVYNFVDFRVICAGCSNCGGRPSGHADGWRLSNDQEDCPTPFWILTFGYSGLFRI